MKGGASMAGPRGRIARIALALTAASIVAVGLYASIRAAVSLSGGDAVTLRYAHMNPRDSVAGLQAEYFAARARELSEGRVRVEIFPDSSLGGISRQLELARDGTVDMHHTTASALGSLFEGFSVLDTPYLVSDPGRLSRIADRDSPLMRTLGAGLEDAAGLTVLYTFYFGARQLTFDAPVLRPEELAGRRIRAIPYPMYELTVRSLGGVPTPIDWAQTPTALATGTVRGQENPTDTILAAKLYRQQSHLMLTGHLLGAEIVVINRRSLNLLSKANRAAVMAAAAEAGDFATRTLVERERRAISELQERGMTVISEAQGLDIEAFRARAKSLVGREYGTRWAKYYDIIERIP